MSRQTRPGQIPHDWVPFGWQGIKVFVPTDWTPASLTGSYEEGYFRLDGPDQPRLEVKWADSRGFVDVERVVSRYLQSLTKGREGRKVQLAESAKSSVKMPRERSSVRFFRWRSDQEAFGAAWYCKTCGRTMLFQVMGPVASDVQGLAEKILAGLDDHPDGETCLWSLYEFSCEVPASFHLVGQRLLTGLLELDFERGRDRLRIARWGLANVALRGTDLQEWLRDKNRRQWRNFNVELKPAQINGHEGLAIAGPTNIPWLHLAAIGVRMLGRRYPDVLRGAAWTCEPGNKIYHVEAVVDPADEDVVAAIIQSISCHRKEGA